ncbi:MAG TPA: STAS domain-containing protein [Acidimicrobiales bacterium]
MAELKAASGAKATAVARRDASGVPIVKLTGEVDMSNVDSVRASVDLAIEHDPERIVFDLGALEFMDSSGLAMLLAVAEKISVVELRRPRPLIRRVIELTGLSTTFVVTA